jgi:ABC-type Fe3+-hydroxamate transport system substrate-binding protein
MPFFSDQLHRTIELKKPPQRIISLVPSQTELLYHLGLEEEVVGITKFCIHPESWFRGKQRIGGTKNINIEKIKTLQPDLIIANKEENVQEQIEELAILFPVWVSDVNTLEEAYDMIEGIGRVTTRSAEATQLITSIKTIFSQLQTPDTKLKTAYLIWKDPFMSIGGDTFIHDMLQQAGFSNIFENHSRYPSITVEGLRTAGCQLLLLSSEPYPFKQKHIDELTSQLPYTKIMLVDGEMFSWYGSRLLKAPAYFHRLHQQIRAMM